MYAKIFSRCKDRIIMENKKSGEAPKFNQGFSLISFNQRSSKTRGTGCLNAGKVKGF